MFAGVVGAQEKWVLLPHPNGVIDGLRMLEHEIIAQYVFCDLVAPPDGMACFYSEVRIDAVTNGVQLNWVPDPLEIAYKPQPNAFLEWRRAYNAYCRFDPMWMKNRAGECISITEDFVYYQRYDFDGEEWEFRIEQMRRNE